jgi:thiol-disulfide isomerase/thioredoxin
LHSEDWKGKVVLLDFWASWCGHCIEGFSILKELRTQLGSSLQIISINTDEPAELSAANKVLREHALPWPSVMSGKGLNDPVWMLFQALGHSLPLYAISIGKAVVRYSGSGGEKLVELRNALEKLIPASLIRRRYTGIRNAVESSRPRQILAPRRQARAGSRVRAGPRTLEPAAPARDQISLNDPNLYLDRELSSLAFQRRVLEEAQDP